MTRGVVMFAHNNGATDYYKMAVYTAKRVNRFLDLPVTVITDPNSVTDDTYTFDSVHYLEPDASNMRSNTTWINKGRYRVYDISPYDETLVLDTDYMVNSQQLLEVFNYSSDIVCHRATRSVLETLQQEQLGKWSAQSAWATVLRFNKTPRARDMFAVMQMVQTNYAHYSTIHRFQKYTYRNDYALTIALRAVNGHIEQREDYLQWSLLHVGLDTAIHRVADTEYVAVRKNKPRSDYVILRDLDFHMLNKSNYMELIDE